MITETKRIVCSLYSFFKYMYIIMFVSYTRLCNIVYVIKKVGWGLGQLMGVAHNRTRARAL